MKRTEFGKSIDTWVVLLFNLLDKIDMDDELKKEIKRSIMSEDSIDEMRTRYRDYLVGEEEIKQIHSFFEYVNELRNKYSDEYFTDALVYSTNYKEEGSDFIDQFVRFITVTNFDDLVFNFDENPYGFVSSLTLGGLRVARIQEIKYIEDENYCYIDWFFAREGLIRTRVGSKLLVETLKQIQSEYGNIDIYSDNVDKENKLGQNFYKKFGFLCVDLPTDTIIDFDNIPKDDYDIVGILLPSDKLDECIERNDNQFPKIEFNGKTIDKNTYKKNKTNKMIRR